MTFCDIVLYIYITVAIFMLKELAIFIRIEPSSAVPIYRQIIDQIKYQIATGSLKEGERLASVRQLAGELAVNQNTILKVYNQLCQEKILRIERGNGTFVAVAPKSMRKTEMKHIVAAHLREAVVEAIHFDLQVEELHELLNNEYQNIKLQEKRK